MTVLSESSPFISHDTTPLPKLQLIILLLVQLAEPITNSVILPFVNQLVNESGITGGDFAKVGYYVGLIESTFFIAEALLTIYWSRLSDSIGRKPIILLGTIGLTLSVLLFGLSHTFMTLLLSRALAGILNGNVPVAKAMMADMCDAKNLAKIAPFMSVVWEVGSTVGPFIGGSLSHPYERFPSLFTWSRFWEFNPYFLSCLAAASCSFSAFFLGLFFLRETHPIILGPDSTSDTSRSSSSSPARSSPPDPSLRIPITAYALLALTDISVSAIFPLFLSSPRTIGGLGLSPPQIGTFLGIMGAIITVVQLGFFEWFVRKLGVRDLYKLGVGAGGAVFVGFWVVSVWVRRESSGTELGVNTEMVVWLVLGLQIVCMIFVSMAFSANYLLLTSITPPHQRGRINGLAQTIASVMRAMGPAGMTMLFAACVDEGSTLRTWFGGGIMSWFVYAIGLCFALSGVRVAGMLPDV